MQVETAYQEAILRKYPEQIVVAIARDPQRKFNPITLGWTMITSGEPPMMAVSIGLSQYSLEAIRMSRSFVICFPSVPMASDVLFFGTNSGRDVDKLATCGTMTEPASRIDCVLLSDAVANFECELVSELRTGDHMILVGSIVAAHTDQSPTAKRLYSLGHDRYGAVSWAR